jgi:hypothetical protein
MRKIGRRGTLNRAHVFAIAAACVPLVVPSSQSHAATQANWLSPTSGDWSDPPNWSTSPNYPNNGFPTGTSYDASITATAAAGYQVALSASVVVDSLHLGSARATLYQNGDSSSLQVNNGLLITDGLYWLESGTLKNTSVTTTGSGALNADFGRATLDNVTFDGAVISGNTVAKMNFTNGLTLSDSGVRLTVGTSIVSESAQTISGNGVLTVDEYAGSNFTTTIGGDNDTIGPGVTIRTGGGTSANANFVKVRCVDNQGTISAEDQTLNLSLVSPTWTNNGTLKVSGGSLGLEGDWTNAAGHSIAATGGVLYLGGTWSNAGTITATNATVGLTGSSTNLGSISLDHSALEIWNAFSTTALNALSITNPVSLSLRQSNAELDNTGAVLALSPATTGDLNLMGGSIHGGSITASDHAKINCLANTALVGVSLFAPVVSSGTGAYLNTTDLDNHADLTFTGGGLSLAGTWTNSGSISISNAGHLQISGTPAGPLIGNISVRQSSIDIYTACDPSMLRQIQTSNAHFYLHDGGILNLNADTFDVSVDQSLTLSGGQVNGGTIRSTDGTVVKISRYSSFTSLILNDVSFATDALITGDVGPTVQGRLELEGAHLTLGATPYGSGYIYSSGDAAISGTGEITLAGDRSTTAAITPKSGSLLIGSGVWIHNAANSAIVGAAAFPVTSNGTISAYAAGKTLTVIGSTLTNNGTLEARYGGTLSIPTSSALTNFSAGTLSGGTFAAYAGSTIALGGNTPPAITTNAATIILDGADSHFPAIDSLAINAGSFTISGGRNFTTAGAFQNSGDLVIGAGSTFVVTGAFTWAGGTISGPGTLMAPSVQVTGDVVCSDPVTRIPGMLSIAEGHHLDLRNGALISGMSAGTATDGTYDGIQGLVQSGRHGGAWDGDGLVTSSAGASNRTTLGVASAAEVTGISTGQTTTWQGQTVSATDTLVMYTYGGDANLDGKINIDDYGLIDSHVGQSGTAFGWHNGDFNYDGKINIDDYGIIDANIGAQGVPFPMALLADGAVAIPGVAAVPEPACLGLLVGAMLMRRRRPR